MRRKVIGKKVAAKKTAGKKSAKKSPPRHKTAPAQNRVNRSSASRVTMSLSKDEGAKGARAKAQTNGAARGSFSHLREIVAWTFVIAAVFGMLSMASSYTKTAGGGSSGFQRKLQQASTLTLLSDDDPVTFTATGNILLARFVEQRMRQLNNYTYPFHKTADFLKTADIAFGNLEAPLLPGRNTPKDSTTFRADLEAAEGLQFAGFDVVSVANNHMMNYQIPGLTSTLKTLKEAGILASGGGKNQDIAHTPAVIEARGRKIAVYSYVDPTIPPGFHGEAKSDLPGVSGMDIEAVKNDVKNALENIGADAVVISMHAGSEYRGEPTVFQKDFAHAAIDAGASVVIGHHPSVIGPVEEYGSGLILYSLGNFVSDQFFSPEVQTGLAAKIYLPAVSGEKPEAEFFPVWIDRGQPRLMEGEEKNVVLKKLGLETAE